MSAASLRKIKREAAKSNPERKREKLKVDSASYFTKRHTEARKLLLPLYAKIKAEARDARLAASKVA